MSIRKDAITVIVGLVLSSVVAFFTHSVYNLYSAPRDYIDLVCAVIICLFAGHNDIWIRNRHLAKANVQESVAQTLFAIRFWHIGKLVFFTLIFTFKWEHLIPALFLVGGSMLAGDIFALWPRLRAVSRRG